MSQNQLRAALRFLGRHKGYSAINILGLTLGLCACLVIYNIVSYEFSFDRSYPDRDRIFRVGGRIRIDNGNGTPEITYGKTIPAPAPDALRSEIPFIEKLAAYYPYNADVLIPPGNTHFSPNGTTILAGSDYFNILPRRWLSGNPTRSLTRPNSVVLTASRARDYFGDLSPAEYIGRELIYDDSLPVTVSGIISDYDGHTDFPYTDFISFSTISHSFLKHRYVNDQWRFNPGIPRIQALVKLQENVNPGEAEVRFNAVLQRHTGNDSFSRFLKYSMVLQPLSDVHFNEKYGNDGIRKADRPALYGLIGIAAFILSLAIVNFINLSTALSLQQTRDIGIRRILGSTRLRLMLRSLSETAILTTLSAIIALALVRPVMALFRDYLPEGVPFKPFSSHILLFMAGTSIVCILLAGLYPAISLVRLKFNHDLLPENTQKLTLRRILVVFQFSISLLFILVALVVGRQIRYMLEADMGFNRSAVVTVAGFDAPPERLRLFSRQALRIPGVQETTMQGHAPTGTTNMDFSMQLDNRTDNTLEVNIQNGDQNFIPLYRMRLLAGHNLSAGDSLREFIINDTYRKALGFSKPVDALGHSLTSKGRMVPIVGVVADFHTGSMHTAIPALAIARVADMDSSIGLRIVTSNRNTLPRLERLWRSFFPDRTFSYSFLDDSIARLYKRDEQVSRLVNISAAIIIFVSCIGLLGLILFIVERKKKEISIRKVLGAGVADIVFLLNKEFIVLVGIALAIACPVAFLVMHRWLQGFAYRIVIPWWIFLLAGLIVLAISILTTSLRVIRAALVNPTKNLRSE